MNALLNTIILTAAPAILDMLSLLVSVAHGFIGGSNEWASILRYVSLR